MSKKSSSSSSIGIGLICLLTIAFIVLKLTDVIDWSWWWILSPIWLPVLLAVWSETMTIITSIITKLRKQ